MNTEPLYRTPDACQFLKIHPNTLRGLVREGKIRPIRIGKRGMRFSADELRRFVAKQEQAA